MRAHERSLEMRGRSLVENGYDRLAGFIDYSGDQELYQNLQEKGLRPIDPEGMGIILMSVVKDIQKRNPNLLP